MSACTSDSARTASAWINRARWRIGLAMGLAGIVAAISIGLADPGSPLAVTKVDTPDPVASGQELTYTITVVNTGGAKVTNVVLSDQLNGVGGIGTPPQLVLTSTRGSCQQNVNLVTCNGGAIEGLGTWVVTIRGIVTAANGTTINNTVSVSGTKSAQNFTTTATATTLVNGGGGSAHPDLTIAKTGPTTVVKSSAMIYTLTVNNLGTANATDIKVSDTLPPGLTGVTQTGTSLFACSNDGGSPQITVTCTGGAVNQGSNATITINATSPSTTGTITNTASVDPDNTIVEGNELNNSSALVNTAVVDSPSGGLLTIDKTDKDNAPAWDDGAGPDPVNPGQVVTYKILVTNPTPNRADDVVIVDGTQGLQAASIQVSQVITNGSIGTFGGCTIAAPQATCSIKSLNAGGTLLMTVSGQVVASAGSSIINTATVTANIKNAGTTSTDTELTTVKPAIDLTVTKADSPDPVCAASWPTSVAKPAPTSPPELAPPVCLGGLTYTFVIGNSGNTTANNVVLRDPLPAGLKFDHATGVAGVFAGGCTDVANVVTCTGGTLGPDSTKTITFVMVAPSAVGTISNTVTIDPANAIFEADETNNTATQTTQVATGIDLTILKQDNGNNFITGAALSGFDPIARSGSQTYTILVDNLGPQDATNIMVRDTLPANTILRSAEGDHGFTCSQTGQTVDCVGGSVKGTMSEFYAGNVEDHATIVIKLFAQPAVGTMHNEVRVDPLNQIAEINENNNFDFEDTKVENGAPGAFNDLTIDKNDTNDTAETWDDDAGPDPVVPGGSLTYKILVTNLGTDPAVDVAVRDVLPATVTFVSAKDVSLGPATAKFTCAAAAGIVDCTGATIAGTDATLLPGVPSERTLEIKVKAPNQQGPLFNQAFVDPDNTIPEGDELNNSSSATTTVTSVINLKITKTGPNSSTQSQVTDYEITLENEAATGSSGQTAFDVDMHDPLPVGLIPLAVDTGTGNNWQCQVGENPINVVDCVGDLEPGAGKKVTIKITVFMTAEGGRSLDNEACIDTLQKIEEFNPPGETDNCSTHSLLVGEKPKLSPDILISKNVDKTLASAGDTLQYTVVVSNSGTAKAKTPVKVKDTLPNTVTLVGTPVTTNNWTCDTSALPAITCQDDGSGLDVGASITITMNVTINDNVTTPITNTAEEDGTAVVDPGPTPDPNVEYVDEVNNNNNKSSVTTSISGAPFDLLIAAVTDSPDPVTVGQPLRYIVTAANGGTQDAPNVVVRVTMPPAADATFISADGSNGFNCSALGAVVANAIDCTGDLPAAGNTVITVNVVPTAAPPADLTLTATIDPGNAFNNESDEGNNTKSETTTVSGTVCVNCVDLVASQLVAAPDPATAGGQVVFSFVIANVGDTPTTLDADPTHGQPLAFFDLSATGTFNFVERTSSDATITCTPPAPINGITALLSDCFGNLGPGKAVVLTIKANALTAGSITAFGTVDPAHLVAEPSPNGENNNHKEQSVVIK
ncbi:MAG TPA: CARDB domain-containing protein [Vicinamibacterales bacterium]|nr:CARDB domain-containing protein [Vicinamibacterales bacterium]